MFKEDLRRGKATRTKEVNQDPSQGEEKRVGYAIKRVISEGNVHKEKLGKIREMRARMRILQQFLKNLSLTQLKSWPSLLMVQRKSGSWILGAFFL